jgi:hypothetical protein
LANTRLEGKKGTSKPLILCVVILDWIVERVYFSEVVSTDVVDASQLPQRLDKLMLEYTMNKGAMIIYTVALGVAFELSTS